MVAVCGYLLPMSDGRYQYPEWHTSGVAYGKMHETACKEQISIAYAQAVVTAGRCKLEEIRVDDEKVDAVIRQEADHPLYDGAQVDVQLKCTSQHVEKNGYYSWPLPRRHYNKLRNPKRICPRILVLMLVPENFTTWVTQSEDSLQLVRAAYWVDLVNHPERDQANISIKVPKAQVFNVEQLLGILSRIGAGGQP